MLELDLQFFAFAIPAVLFAAISKAGFGSGASFAAAAILALVVPPGMALGIMLPLLMLIDFASLKPYWGKWHWPSALWLMIGALPGVAIGAWLYIVVDADVFRVLIGTMCLLFVVWRWVNSAGLVRVGTIAFNRLTCSLVGTFAGFTSFVSHAGGPPVAIYLLSLGLSKTTYQATTILAFWVVNLMKFVPYGFIGIFSWETFMADLILAPVALIGTWLGVKAHYWMPERAFFILTYVILTVTGLRLIWVALT